ncbi:hypothetical protein [Actinopolymorpha rutila]|uniref:Uncharacterized protein n=1 Tax=Actinopolymorpha rutila TaxID=446787 RepID=A0A852Z9X3_9ACTN|nr:hypothetical protein [Actinopolymorpha rutila]NYH88548.1 hypothetical protein [Actinopolymorpha rutila]
MAEVAATNHPDHPDHPEPASEPASARPGDRATGPDAPRPAVVEPHLAGRRVVLIAVDEEKGTAHYTHGHRAASDVLVDPEGVPVVQVAPERSWQAWRKRGTGRCPEAFPWPADLVWVA